MIDDFAKPDLENLSVIDAATATAPTLYKVTPYTDADRARAAHQRGRGAFSFAAQPMTEANSPSRRLPPDHREALGPDFEAACDAVVKELQAEGKWHEPPPPTPRRNRRKTKGNAQ